MSAATAISLGLAKNSTGLLFICHDQFAAPSPVHTYFIGHEEVNAYAKHFAQVICPKVEEFPSVWCPLGRSGEEITGVIATHLDTEKQSEIVVLPIQYDRDTNTAAFEKQDAASDVLGKVVLIIDSSVHSGSTMRACITEAYRLGAAKVLTYSLVIKRGSSVIPNYYGVMISDFDRAYYLLDRIPTNTVCQHGTIQKMVASDVHRDPPGINSGLQSLDALTWSDLWYDCVAKDSHVYLCTQNSHILGFVSFSLREDKTLFVDAVAVDKACQGKKLGGSLMRWAEIYARSHNCHGIELWAINERVAFYESMGYKSTGQTLDLGREHYTMMTRRLLYNLKPRPATA